VFNDSRIHLLENNSFHSPIYNLENALKNAKGDFVFLSDQDDEWTVDKVSVCMEKLKDCDLVIHDADIVDGNGIQTAKSFFKLNHTKKGKFYNLLKNGYHGCCMCFSKKLCEALLPFPKELPMHDSYIGNFAAFNGYKVKFTDEKLIHYRRHNSNASNSSEKSRRPFFARVKDRIILLKSIKK